jgi:hypothetical protein
MSNTDAKPELPAPLTGWLHIYVAFDWGDEIDLTRARQAGPYVALDLTRRPRTPSSFAFQRAPLRFQLAPVSVDLPGAGGLSPRPISAEATVFDFAAASVAMRVPFELSPAELTDLAGHLSEGQTAGAIVQAARAAVDPLHRKLLPAIQKPNWADSLWEEYFVFQFPPQQGLEPEVLLGPQAGWVMGLVRLEDEPLSASEIAEATRLSLRYGRADLFVPDWAAALLLDQDKECAETLQAIEFANLQLLEFRNIDNRLDGVLAQADHLLERTTRSRLSSWRGPASSLRILGELKVEANGLFERTGNVLKLVGDPYLARVYRMLATRFHLREWERSIARKLEVVEGVYEVISDQSAHFRTELLELVVILLITIEILLTLFAKH